MSHTNDDHQRKPWGFWFTPHFRNGEFHHLTDDAGREWKSVRDAFWTGWLNMCGCDERIMNQHLDRLTKLLGGACLPVQDRAPLASLMDGGSDYFISYMCWLSALALVEHDVTPFDSARTSPLGRSVLDMLVLTQGDPETGGGGVRYVAVPGRPKAATFERRRTRKLLPAPGADPS